MKRDYEAKYYLVTVDTNYIAPILMGWYGKIDRKSWKEKIPNVETFNVSDRGAYADGFYGCENK